MFTLPLYFFQGSNGTTQPQPMDVDVDGSVDAARERTPAPCNGAASVGKSVEGVVRERTPAAAAASPRGRSN